MQHAGADDHGLWNAVEHDAEPDGDGCTTVLLGFLGEIRDGTHRPTVLQAAHRTPDPACGIVSIEFVTLSEVAGDIFRLHQLTHLFFQQG